MDDILKKISDSGKLTVIAFAWFAREDWERWTEICPDLRTYRDYDHWSVVIEAKISRSLGAFRDCVQKVTIKPDEFLKWVVATGTPVNSDARAAFAAITRRKRHADH